MVIESFEETETITAKETIRIETKANKGIFLDIFYL
jgi:hypothetical protein